jgi:6-pyruvoyl-tetrahydropterin synthase
VRLTVVTGSFAADHVAPYGKHRHGHDWHVRAAVAPDGHKDGPQARLDNVLSVLDHGFLDALVPDPSNEGVAEWIAGQLGAAWVYVWRYDRGREFGGEWRA